MSSPMYCIKKVTRLAFLNAGFQQDPQLEEFSRYAVRCVVVALSTSFRTS